MYQILRYYLDDNFSRGVFVDEAKECNGKRSQTTYARVRLQVGGRFWEDDGQKSSTGLSGGSVRKENMCALLRMPGDRKR